MEGDALQKLKQKATTTYHLEVDNESLAKDSEYDTVFKTKQNTANTFVCRHTKMHSSDEQEEKAMTESKRATYIGLHLTLSPSHISLSATAIDLPAENHGLEHRPTRCNSPFYLTNITQRPSMEFVLCSASSSVFSITNFRPWNHV